MSRVRFGGITALDHASFSVERGEICGLIGPNGAGKTTLFNVISRIYDPTSGSITFDGQDVLRHPPAPDLRARHLPNVPEPGPVAGDDGARERDGRRPLRHEGQLRHRAAAARHPRRGATTARAVLRAARSASELAEVAFQPAAGLPFGTLKRVEIARALAGDPKMLMLDEPAGGLTHAEVDELATLIRRLRDEFTLTILLVEHHMAMVMGISDKVVVLDFGRKIAEGTPQPGRQRSEGHRGLPGGESTHHRHGTSASRPTATAHAGETLLEVTDLEGPLRRSRGAPRGRLPRRPRRGRRHPRGQRRRQDDDPAGDLPDGRPPRARSCSTARSSPGDDDREIVRRGVAHVPQGRGTLNDLSVEDNLLAGAYVRRDDEVGDDIERWFDMFPRLRERRTQHAGSLSGGEQQMLAVARALMSRPKLLLLDEPSLGLAPLIVQDMFRVFGEINASEGTTMLVVEQNANIALDLADRAYVLEAGQTVLSGSADDLRHDDAVRKAYLGY